MIVVPKIEKTIIFFKPKRKFFLKKMKNDFNVYALDIRTETLPKSRRRLKGFKPGSH